MAQTPVHHIVKKHQKHSPHLFDHLMYGIALIAPVMTLPQLYQVWVFRQTKGVSLLTWGAYAIVSGLWLAYGIHHKDKPLILTQCLLLLLDTGIVLGVLMHY